MPHTVSFIGVEPHELSWLRMLVSLLRHPDPSIPELTRQALLYLTDAASQDPRRQGNSLDRKG